MNWHMESNGPGEWQLVCLAGLFLAVLALAISMIRARWRRG